MKKTFILAAICTAMQASAYDEIGLHPVTLTAGESTQIAVYAGAADGVLRGAVLDLQLPDDWSIALTDDDLTNVATGWTVSNTKTNHFVAYSTTYNSPLESTTSSKLFTLTITVPSGAADGYYAIQTLPSSQLGFSGIDGTTWSSVNQVSYVQVGSSATSMAAAEGILLSFAVEELNDNSSLKSLDLSATTTINTPTEGFAFVDGRELGVPETEGEQLTVSKATYTRTTDEGEYGSVKLPFTTTSGTYYTYNSNASNDGTIVFSPQEGLEAGTPAIAIGSISAEGSDVTLTSQKSTTYTSGYYLWSNNLVKITSSVNLAPYRAVFDFNGQEVKAFTLSDGTADGIEVNLANSTTNDQTVYDLTGRRVSAGNRGVHIVDGQKLIVK